VLNDAGVVVEVQEYDAYGKASFYNGSGTYVGGYTQNSVGNPFQWKGHRVDPETGLTYMRNRYYASAWGRFLTQDPLGVWGDPVTMGNGYGYGAASPPVQSDRLGLQIEGKHISGSIFGSDDKAGAAILDAQDRVVGVTALASTAAALRFGPRVLAQAGALASALFRRGARGLPSKSKPKLNSCPPGPQGVGGGSSTSVAGQTASELLVSGGSRIGQVGASASIRVVQGGGDEAVALFQQLARAGAEVAGTKYPGILVRLPCGGTVGLRSVATATGSRAAPAATIDVNIVDIAIREIKFIP
jgi:RHS repeat-associated protein